MHFESNRFPSEEQLRRKIPRNCFPNNLAKCDLRVEKHRFEGTNHKVRDNLLIAIAIFFSFGIIFKNTEQISQKALPKQILINFYLQKLILIYLH